MGSVEVFENIMAPMTEKIFITGASGFLGKALIEALSPQFQLICLIHNNTLQSQTTRKNVTMIRDNRDFFHAIAASDRSHIIHAATKYGGGSELKEIMNCNIYLPLTLAALCAAKSHHFLNVDSFFTKKEFENYEHLSDYIETKRRIKTTLYSLSAAGVLNLTNCMVFHMYGPSDSPTKFVPSLIKDLKSHASVPMTDGENARDFVHVEDVAKGIAAAVKNRRPSTLGLLEAELGSGRNVKIREFAELAKATLKSSSKLNFGERPQRVSEVTVGPAVLEKNDWLNWRPRYCLEEGLASLR